MTQRRTWRGIDDAGDRATAAAVAVAVMTSYWKSFVARSADRGAVESLGLNVPRSVSGFISPELELPELEEEIEYQAQRTAARFADQDPVAAAFHIGSVYTSLLPRKYRSTYGIYYTPVSLSGRLIDMSEKAGTDWSTARVLDPACGGGAFVGPVAARMADSLYGRNGADVLNHFSKHLCGYEIDPLGAWLSQVVFDAVALEFSLLAGQRSPRIINVQDSLAEVPIDDLFDLVIGNPPYGKVKLSPAKREMYDRSLYGHANLYGLFTHQALRLTRPGGVIAFITPTSFLSGEYFKNLRSLLADEAPPTSVDFIDSRRGVFEDVLQETVLATYRRGCTAASGTTHVLEAASNEQINALPTGSFELPSDGSAPWILARSVDSAQLVRRILRMPHRLADYGYAVTTGPLVWNRHKSQLRQRRVEYTYPLIWAEAVTRAGEFVFRATKKNHTLYFRAEGARDEWLLTRESCVLLQRTTAKEQHRRLIAALMPASFVEKHGAVVIENHLNVLRPTMDNPGMSPAILAMLLNSGSVDRAFRCINGSVAVSAYELNALPLPAPDKIAELERMLHIGASKHDIDNVVTELYLANEPSPTLEMAGDWTAA